jgi:PAS domain S-box-containing protein
MLPILWFLSSAHVLAFTFWRDRSDKTAVGVEPATTVVWEVCEILARNLAKGRADLAVSGTLAALTKATGSHAAAFWPWGARYCEDPAWIPAEHAASALDVASLKQCWVVERDMCAAPVGCESLIALFPRPGNVLRHGLSQVLAPLLPILAPLAAARTVREEETKAAGHTRLLSLIARHTSDAILLCDPRGRIEWVNEGFERMYGYSLDEARGRRPGDFLHGPDPGARGFEGPAAREPFVAEFQAIRKNGARCWIRVTGHPLRDDSGAIAHHFRICTDISEQRRLEIELRHFRALADSTPTLVWLSGADKRFTYLNQSWLRFTGREMGQELGDGWLEGVHPEDRDRCRSVYAERFNARTGFRVEFRLRRHDGAYRWIACDGEPSFDPEGKLLGYAGSGHDIHDRDEGKPRQSPAIPDLRLLVDRDGMVAEPPSGPAFSCHPPFAENLLNLERKLGALVVEDKPANREGAQAGQTREVLE